MPNELQQLIERTVSASHLELQEKEELRRELQSHILAHIYELEVSGKSEAEIIATIKEAFGDTEEIGKQLFFAHRRFERIPWFGPFFYYMPLLAAIRLAFIHILLFGLMAVLYMSQLGNILFREDVNNGDHPGLLAEILFVYVPYAGSYIVPVLLLLVGYRTARNNITVLGYIETVILSFIPYIAVAGMIVLGGLLRSGNTFSHYFVSGEGMIYFWAYVAILFVGGAIYFTKEHIRLWKKQNQ